MTGTNESKVDSMKERFNFDSGVAADSGNKRSAGTANGQTQLRCHTEVQNQTQEDDANSDSTGQYYDAQYQFIQTQEGSLSNSNNEVQPDYLIRDSSDAYFMTPKTTYTPLES